MKCFSIVFVGLALCGVVLDLPAQEREFDFTKDPNVQIRFLPNGLAHDLPFKFLAQGNGTGKVKAILPEEGRFEVVLNHAGNVKVQNVKTSPADDGNGFVGEADFVVEMKRLSPDDVRSQAESKILDLLPNELQKARKEREKKKLVELEVYVNRKGFKPPKDDEKLKSLYDKVRAAEMAKDLLREKLKEAMQRRTDWYLKSDVEGTDELSGPDAMVAYGELLSMEIAEPYLKEMGLQFEVGPRNFRDVIWNHLTGIDALLSGSSNEDKQKALRGLPAEIREELRNAIYVDARLRFWPAADDNDPNSQWFLAQRVNCQVRGVESVRIEGRLDPTAGDSADWWILRGLDRDKLEIEWPRDKGIRYEIHEEASAEAKLRLVVTGNEPVDYVIEMKSKGARTGGRVVIVETPSDPKAGFPF